jgi:RHS repeat-associated protein
LFDGQNPVQELSNSAVVANLLTGLEIDEVFDRATTASGMTQFRLTDILGSAIALTSAIGDVEGETTYEPFGATMSQGVSSTYSQFTARDNDETSLYYYRARYYSPELQRFISEDPIRFNGGVNFFSYVNNDPVNYTDPKGLFIYSYHRDSMQRMAIAVGCSAVSSEQLSRMAGNADWYPSWRESQDPSNNFRHAMCRPGESPKGGGLALERFIDSEVNSCTARGLANAVHAAQDSAAGGHKGCQETPNGKFAWMVHIWQDVFPSLSDVSAADVHTLKIFSRYKNACGCLCR